VADAQAFLDAILETPDDDAHRLVYADWLDDHGDAERAEFIRAQVELARGVEDEPRRDSLRRRERELLLANELRWLGPLGSVLRRAAFVRGLVERVTVRADRLKEAVAHFRLAPIRHLILLDVKEMAEAAALPELRRITTLDLRGDDTSLTVDGLREIAGSPHLAGVTRLVLRQIRLERPLAKALANTPGLSRLRTLDLHGWSGRSPVEPLARSPYLAGLTTLILGGSDDHLGDHNAVKLAAEGCRLTSLRRLHVAHAMLGDDGARALAAAPHLAGLERLDAGGNDFTPAGRRALKVRFGERVRW
jgi:uncharacterized protein (TIGR02996 family)